MQSTLRLKLLSLLASVAAASCGGGGGSGSDAIAPPPSVAPPPSMAPQSVKNTNLMPAVIDPRVTTSLETHIAINPVPDVKAADKLFVFLPGTGAIPNGYELILQEAAARGFHAVGLNYPNPKAVGIICDASSTDPDCFFNVRREVITGQDLSPDIAVAVPDSIVSRLAGALAYLNTNSPDQRWGQYLNGDGTVNWSKVVISGHSQGGGHAGVMTKLYAMHRACFFDSPPDWDVNAGAPAGWQSAANVTPAASQFGFTNLNDPLVPYDQLSAIWKAMGLGAAGAAVSVDSTAAPFNGSHELTTAIMPAMGGGGTALHSVAIADPFTPLASDGKPMFGPVWDYLCFQ